MSSIVRRRIPSAESTSMDWLDALISTVGVVSTVTEPPLPWVSAAAEVVLKLLKRIKSSMQNAEDLKDLACSVVDFIVLLRDSTIRHTEISLESSHDNPFKQTCIEFTNTLTTILNDLNTMKNRDNNWLKKYLKTDSIARTIARHKESWRHIQDQLTTRAAVESGFYLPLIKDDLSSHRAESREHFQELRSHIVGNYYRGQFRVIKRGDLQLIRQHAVNREYVVEIQTTGVVSTQKLTKRQRRRRRFYGDIHINLKESFETIDWVANVCGERDERVVRQYKGAQSETRFEEDLELYQNAMHSNIAQVFAIIPELHSIVFYDDATFTLREYLANIPSSTDKFIAECRIRNDIASLNEYCKTNPYCVYMFWEFIPISRYTEHVSLTFGQTGEITVANENISYRNPKFGVYGFNGPIFRFNGRSDHRIPSIEISNLFNKKRTNRLPRLSLLPTLYSAVGAIQDSVWDRPQYIQLTAEPYKTSILGFGCVLRIIPDGFEKIAQLPLCHGPDTYSRQRIQFRWEVRGTRMLQIGGWRRVEVSSPNMLWLTAHPFTKPKPRTDIVLSQIHRLALLSGVRETDLTCVESIWFNLTFRPAVPRLDTTGLVGLAGTFMSENDDPMYGRKQEKAYMFIRDMEVNMYDDTSVLTTPEMYWASEPEGVVRWTEEELTEYLATWELRTDDLRLKVVYRTCSFKKEHLEAFREAHRLCGFDPDSDEIAKALGYPILEVKPTFMPWRIMAPRPDSEENEEVDHTEPGSNVDTRSGTDHVQSGIVEVDDTGITPVPMDQLSPEKSASCVSDYDSGATKPEDQRTIVENTQEPVESKSAADCLDFTFVDEVFEQHTATSNEAYTAKDRSESCRPSDDAILDDPEVTQSEIGSLESSPSVSSTEECPPPVTSIEEVSASKTYCATEQICQSEIQASACRKLLKTLCLVFPPTFILGILIGILFTLAYYSPYLVIPKISVHVEF